MCKNADIYYNQEVDDGAFAYWADLNDRLGKEPSLLDSSDPLLYIGRKPDY